MLNDCLRKNVAFGILARKAYPEIPLRVEYAFTPFGTKFVRVLDDLEKHQEELKGERPPAAARDRQATQS